MSHMSVFRVNFCGLIDTRSYYGMTKSKTQAHDFNFFICMLFSDSIQYIFRLEILSITWLNLSFSHFQMDEPLATK